MDADVQIVVMPASYNRISDSGGASGSFTFIQNELLMLSRRSREVVPDTSLSDDTQVYSHCFPPKK